MKDWYMFPCEITEKSISDAIIYIFRQTHEDTNLEFTLYVSSIGGDIDSAIRFYDFIKSLPIKVNTVGFGQVDSAALILFLVGKEFWDMLGGENTYEDLLKVFEEAGIELRREIDSRMKVFNLTSPST